MKKYLEFIIGILLSSTGFVFFISPCDAIFGGVTGISRLINSIYGIDVAYLVLIFNIILLILSLILLGKEKTAKSVVGSIAYPFALELVALVRAYVPSIEIETVLSVIIGGILCGTGMGLVLRTGFTSGGTDIVYQILSKYGKMTMGRAALITEAIIVTCSIFILGISNFIYSLVAVYILTKTIDKIVVGMSSSKTFIIISKKVETVRSYMEGKAHIKVKSVRTKSGLFTHEDILICAVPTKDYVELKNNLISIDNEVQILVSDVYETINV